ncbi:MAG: EAL domain-containing protein, partial [Bacillota bacterium]|nr:EAL domain-containing protein [Bacillota bacterium]
KLAMISVISLIALLLVLRRRYSVNGGRMLKVLLVCFTLHWFVIPLIQIYLIENGMPPTTDSFFVNLVKFLSQVMIYLILWFPFISSFRTLNKLQLLIDTAVSMYTVIFLGYFVVSYDQQAQILVGYSLFFTLVTSITIAANCVSFCTILLSTRLRSLSAVFLATMLGFATNFFFYLFAVIDIRKSGAEFSRVTFTSYVILIVLIALGLLLDRYRPVEPIDPHIPQNYRISYRSVLLMIFPIFMLWNRLISWTHFFIVLTGIAFQQLASYQVQKTIQASLKAGAEQKIAERLEVLVSERTAELEKLNNELVIASITDPMTGLNNRRHFIDHLRKLEAEQTPFVIYYMDFDHFKVINDVHGHATGDVLIKRIAHRLSKQLPDDCYLARVGDDEFVVVMPSSGKGFDASREVRVSQQIADAVCDRIYVAEFAFDVGVSIGVSNYPSDSESGEEVMKFAILAMQEAKRGSGGRKILFYNKNYGFRIERENKIEYLLKNVNFDEELQLHYQPQFDITNNRIIGFEALVRWNSPELGSIAPGEFIAIAEKTGSIIKLGKWIIERAFRQAKIWNENSLSTIRVAINLSPLQFDSVELLPYIRMQVLRMGINPKWIEFEVTESINLKPGSVIQEVFYDLRSMGFRIAIDDFGTGYSSLSYIKNFKVHRIKIAKELVDHIAESQEERVIIQAIIAIAQGMKIEVLAEGCETKRQLDSLIESGCTQIQGFYFARPVDVQTINEQFLGQA